LNRHIYALVLERNGTTILYSLLHIAVLSLHVCHLSGSISAEHGIGQQKRSALLLARSPAEIELMRAIKAAVDPFNIMNPNKVLPNAEQ